MADVEIPDEKIVQESENPEEKENKSPMKSILDESKHEVTISLNSEISGEDDIRIETIPDNFASSHKPSPFKESTQRKDIRKQQVFDMLDKSSESYADSADTAYGMKEIANRPAAGSERMETSF